MDLNGIIAIGGKNGLFKNIAQSSNFIVVESLLDKKRFPVHDASKISSLEDISIYTESDNVPLKDVFFLILKKENGGKAINHKSSTKELEEYFEEILPNYDKDAVFISDIKKVFQWYNSLVSTKTITKKDIIEEKKDAEIEKKEVVEKK